MEEFQKECDQRVLAGDKWQSVAWRAKRDEDYDYKPSGRALQLCHDELIERCLIDRDIIAWKINMSNHPDGIRSFITAAHQGISLPMILASSGDYEKLKVFLDPLGDVHPTSLKKCMAVAAQRCPSDCIAKVVAILKDHRVGQMDIDDNNRTPLALWLERDDISETTRLRFMSLFFSKDAMVFPDEGGISAWHRVINFGQSEVISQMGAHLSPEILNTPDIRGWTAADWLAAAKSKRLMAPLKALGMEIVNQEMTTRLASSTGWDTFMDDFSRAGTRYARPASSEIYKPSIKNEQLGLF